MLSELREALEKLDEVLNLFSEPSEQTNEAHFYYPLEQSILRSKTILNDELYRREREILSNLKK